MPFTWNIPLLQETAIAFQDSFEEKDPIRSARAFIYQILTKKGAEWIDLEGNGAVIVTTIDKHGSQKKENIPLKDIKIEKYIPKSDPEWFPEFWEKEDLQSFETKIGDNLIEKLKNVFAVNRYVTTELNNSILVNQAKLEFPPEQKEKAKDELDALKKQIKEHDKITLEKFLHGAVFTELLNKVREYEKTLLDKEYETLYPAEKPKKEGPKRSTKKSI